MADDGLLHWVSIELSDDQNNRISELEKLAACPILTCASKLTNQKVNGSIPSESTKVKDSIPPSDNKDVSLRQWYIQCANDNPPELPLIQKTVSKV
jgi:hypothetical protein